MELHEFLFLYYEKWLSPYLWPVLSPCMPAQGKPTWNMAKSSAATVLSLQHKAGLGWRISAVQTGKRVQTSALDEYFGSWWARDSDLGGGGEGILCPTFSLPLHISGQCSSQSGEIWFPAHALRNMGSPGSPENHGWTNIKILGKSISQTDVQAQLFYKGSQVEGSIDCGQFPIRDPTSLLIYLNWPRAVHGGRMGKSSDRGLGAAG